MNPVDYIEQTFKQHHFLIHASNLLRKLNDEKNAVKKANLKRLAERYAEYLEANLKLKGYSDKVIIKRVGLLNQYYDFYDNDPFGFNSHFSSQGKLRSTILEEFMCLVFRDYIDYLVKQSGAANDVVTIGAANAYTNLFFSPSCFDGSLKESSVKINVKEQDFAICRTVNIQIADKQNQSVELKVPMAAIEVKTYLDKTMLEGFASTAQKLKMGNPYAKAIIVAESYQVSTDVDPSSSDIDQIYVLRKCGSLRGMADIPPIYQDVVLAMFHEVAQHLERPWCDIKKKLTQTGKVI